MLTPSAVQTTYTRFLTVGQVGMVVDQSDWAIDTRIAEDLAAPAGLGFGLAVSQGTLHGDRSACLGQLSGRAFVGITVQDPTLPQAASTHVDKYADGDNMAVLIRGDVWVVAADTVLAGGAVYMNSQTGALGASGISNAVQILNAIWMTSAPTTGLMSTEVGTFAVVRLNGIGAV